tara:strand:- start:2441 stop:4144 length:1704 start_codon:yes stop_codon:yes gene_type:complete
MAKIIGITGGGNHHDAGISYIDNGKIKYAVSEERPRRQKNYKIIHEKPTDSIRVFERDNNMKLNDADYIVLASPNSLSVGNFFQDYGVTDRSKVSVVNHHTCHVYGAFYTSGFQEKTITLSMDGGGMTQDELSGNCYTKTFLSDKGNILEEVHTGIVGRESTIAGLYAAFTSYLGFKSLKDEGKLTGMAAHGKVWEDLYTSLHNIHQYSEETQYIEVPNYNRNSFYSTGSYLNQLISLCRLRDEFKNNVKKRYEGDEWSHHLYRCDLAATVQKICEVGALDKVNHLHKLYPEYKKICLTGGLFANVKINQKINELDWVDEVYVYPPMTDCGLNLGAALHKAVELGDVKKSKKFDNVFLGTSYNQKQVDDIYFNRNGKDDDFKNIVRHSLDLDFVGKELDDGKIVGWVNGRYEFGPRALGARSILSKTTERGVHEELNSRLGRNEVMPFAPIVLDEYADIVFETNGKSHYTAEFMTICYQTRDEWKDTIPAVVHVDGSARPQIVKSDNPFYGVLKKYHEISKIPVLLNTSFNNHGEPIIESPGQALRHLKNGIVDLLVIDNHHYIRSE